MSLKISRKLFNNYNKIFEVIFEDGTVVGGTYSLQLRDEKNKYPFTTVSFVVTAFPNNCEGVSQEYIDLASYSIEAHIKNRIERLIIENF
jgi:hypothetical protein